MNGNPKFANVAPRASLPLDVGSVHSVEDLKAMFEPRRRRFGRNVPSAIAFPNAALETTRTKCSWLSQHDKDKSRKLVPEKVKLFEEGRFDSSLSYTKRGMSMDDLLFIGNSVPMRKKDLLKSTNSYQRSPWNQKPNDTKNDVCRPYYSSDKTRSSDYVVSSSWDDEWETNKEDLLPPPEAFHRFAFGRHQKRASTGRILFEDDPSVWKLTDSFATQVISDCSSTCSESHSISSHEEADGSNNFNMANNDPLVDKKTARLSPTTHHRRRYSTGRIGQVHVTQESITSPKDFWQVYQEDNDAASHNDDDPTLLQTEYRRTVRFDHHVTVWTFVKGTKKQRRTKRRRRLRRKDFRFQKKGHEHFKHTSPPDMPLRQGTNHDGITSSRHNSVVLPQTDRHFSLKNSFSDLPNSVLPDTSPPMIPKRRPSLTQTDILSMPVLEHDNEILSFANPLRRDSTSTWGSLSSFANHDNMDETNHDGHISHQPHPLHDKQCTPTTPVVEIATTTTTTTAAEKRRRARHKSCSGSTSIHERRTKAMQWFHRLGMPNRDAMKRLVTQTAGMDITVEDVDLLPWDDAKYHRTGWASLHTTHTYHS